MRSLLLIAAFAIGAASSASAAEFRAAPCNFEASAPGSFDLERSNAAGSSVAAQVFHPSHSIIWPCQPKSSTALPGQAELCDQADGEPKVITCSFDADAAGRYVKAIVLSETDAAAFVTGTWVGPQSIFSLTLTDYRQKITPEERLRIFENLAATVSFVASSP